ncbi:MAG TPA: hypothetical protein ENI76_10825 [Ignavibacteria bacterium]|nr:hypothetical protein [Ignavibacteria bacterium]
MYKDLEIGHKIAIKLTIGEVTRLIEGAFQGYEEKPHKAIIKLDLNCIDTIHITTDLEMFKTYKELLVEV